MTTNSSQVSDSGRLARAIASVSGWATRHSKITLASWFAFVAASVAAGAMTGTVSLSDDDAQVGESGRAHAAITAAGMADPPSELVMFRGDREKVAAAEASAAARLRAVPQVASVTSAGMNPDGSRLLRATLSGSIDDAGERVVPVNAVIDVVQRQHPGVQIDQAGDGSLALGFDGMIESDLRRAEVLSLPLTLVILLLTFGALVAASVPLLLGITSAAAALGLMGPLSHLVPAHDATGALIVLIGLAVGVDYSLFCIRREREERANGAESGQALAMTLATVGRAVTVAGITVMVAMSGLILTGLPDFRSMALGTMTVVAIAVLGSLTALPAALALLGDRVDRGRLPLLGRRKSAKVVAARGGGGAASAAWGRLAGRVTARPVLALTVGGALMLSLAVPGLSLNPAGMELGSLPDSVQVVRAYKAIDATFPGSPAEAQVVVTGAAIDQPDERQALERLGARAAAITDGAGGASLRISDDRRTAVIGVPMPDRGAKKIADVTGQLRATLHPLASTVGPDASLTVGGWQAEDADFSAKLGSATPLVVLVVLGLALLILLAAFRSPILAVGVIMLNLMSVGVAYGVLAAVFQHTWAEGLLGFTSSGSVANWIPLFLFVILFGLSMDYTILVLERIREARLAGRSPREAAAEGVAATAGTVTSAAIVMVAVFLLFAIMQFPDNKQLGVGLSTAILIDATLVRGVMLPALVAVIGDRWRFSPPPPRGRAAVVVPSEAAA